MIKKIFFFTSKTSRRNKIYLNGQNKYPEVISAGRFNCESTSMKNINRGKDYLNLDLNLW